jgi:type I restriction enzyme R subunit
VISWGERGILREAIKTGIPLHFLVSGVRRMKEAAARIKINKLLEAAGWRFFADGTLPANIQLEPSVTLKTQDLDALGENFEQAKKGFIDFLLLNEKGFPFIVLEAKAEDKSPLVGKEQARKYARSQNCRFVILSNGNLHYFWDLERSNPYLITSFPTPGSVTGYQKTAPNPNRLIAETISDDYIVLTQRPGYAAEAAWKNETERPGFIGANGLRFLRPYQKKAISALQSAVNKGQDRLKWPPVLGRLLLQPQSLSFFFAQETPSAYSFS